ncbi:MAG: ANTAR domain-containing protein [Sulfuricaulis sp.]|uniref:ANTAR domain-containing response regulator n=1 Tax=Sulfuricaulis sp. TaxID=2003553 RepID=UPI0034A1222D
MSLCVLLVENDRARAAIVTPALREAGYEVITVVDLSTEKLEQVRALRPDLIIIDRQSPDRDVLEHIRLLARDEPRPIVLFTDDGDRDSIRAAVRAGVSSYVVGNPSADRIRPIMEVALARFEEFQRLREQLDKANLRLADRKLIERAKGLVMRQRGVSEGEAYQLLRKTAMDRNQRLVEVAENVIAMAELLT